MKKKVLCKRMERKGEGMLRNEEKTPSPWPKNRKGVVAQGEKKPHNSAGSFLKERRGGSLSRYLYSKIITA